MGNEVATREVGARTALTEKLLANARKPLNQIAELTGLTPAQVSEKYAILFEDHGWMTERQEERLLIIELNDFIQDARERMKHASDEDYASIARVVNKGMADMALRLERRKKLVDDDINQITRANAKQFAHAYDIALSVVVEGLRKEHPEITDEEVALYSDAGLRRAKSVLDANVAV